MIKCALLIFEYTLTSIGSQGTWREWFNCFRTGLISPCTFVFNELITSETWTQFSFEWFRLTNFYTMIFTDMNLNPKMFSLFTFKSFVFIAAGDGLSSLKTVRRGICAQWRRPLIALTFAVDNRRPWGLTL